VNRNFLSFLLLDVPAPATDASVPARCPGGVAWAGSLWPALFLLPSATGCRFVWDSQYYRLSDFPDPFVIDVLLGDFRRVPGDAAFWDWISRFPCEVSAYVHGVSDAGTRTLRISRSRWPSAFLTASAVPEKFLTRLIPARTFPCQRFDATLP